MRQVKHYMMIGMIFVFIIGSLAHFLYDWSDNHYLVGLFTPVNESIWEHMKLLFFPMLLYSALLIFRFGRSYPCIVPALCAGLSLGTASIPILFYSYTAIIGKDVFILDIATFIISILIAFLLSYQFTLSCRLKPCTFLLCCLVCILFIGFILFTYHPPDLSIFMDPTLSQET